MFVLLELGRSSFQGVIKAYTGQPLLFSVVKVPYLYSSSLDAYSPEYNTVLVHPMRNQV